MGSPEESDPPSGPDSSSRTVPPRGHGLAQQATGVEGHTAIIWLEWYCSTSWFVHDTARGKAPAGCFCLKKKILRLCRVDAFENPQFTWVPQARVSDPIARMGLRAPDRIVGSRGYGIGSSKVAIYHKHRRGFCPALASRTPEVYHASTAPASGYPRHSRFL